jgi:hypothetical protein
MTDTETTATESRNGSTVEQNETRHTPARLNHMSRFLPLGVQQ